MRLQTAAHAHASTNPTQNQPRRPLLAPAAAGGCRPGVEAPPFDLWPMGIATAHGQSASQPHCEMALAVPGQMPDQGRGDARHLATLLDNLDDRFVGASRCIVERTDP